MVILGSGVSVAYFNAGSPDMIASLYAGKL